MANLLVEKHNIFWHEYEIIVAAGAMAGLGSTRFRQCERQSGADSIARQSRCRAASSPLASPRSCT
jgi:hypothetical protein